MISTDTTALVEKVRDLAATAPHKTAICSYVTHDGDEGIDQPECIMAHAWVALGATIPELLGLGTRGVATALLGLNWATDVADWQRQDAIWLSIVQSHQDNYYTWAQAVEAADEYIEQRWAEHKDAHR